MDDLGKNVPLDTPYSQFADHNKQQIQQLLSRFCGPCKNELSGHIEQFLDFLIHNKEATLTLPPMNLGAASNILLNMGLYLGNTQHAGWQLTRLLDEN